MNGILLVDKPKGWTSFDVVARVRGIVKAELRKTNPQLKNVKVGHTGTLDPAATGLLVLCIGKYTKKVPLMIKHDKTYVVEATLGSSSTTGDSEGEIALLPDQQPISREEVEIALAKFVGNSMQTPPAFSAIKINGKRAYDLARAGKEVVIEPRPITIHSANLISYNYPVLIFECSVSSGTYIRSLVEDLGRSLGTVAYMSNLRRTKVANYDISKAITTDALSFEQIANHVLTEDIL